MSDDIILSMEDILKMLDALIEQRPGGCWDGVWWDGFYSGRQKPCPFFVDWPDENLVSYIEDGRIPSGRVLELGCGHGRNAIYLACQGWDVEAVDFSQKAIAWAKERAHRTGVTIHFQCQSIFEVEINPHAYDLVYDSGCFHHLPPHRRPNYIELVRNALKPEGHFGLVCFTPEGGSKLSNQEVYEKRTLGGGLGYSEEQLRRMFSKSFDIIELRRMKEMDNGSQRFGKEFLWAALMQLSTLA